MKCLVYGCQNDSGQGVFHGAICAPCFKTLRTGIIGPTTAFFAPLQDRNANRTTPGLDGTVRKAHYGDGEQPWDVIVRLGWGPEFAASCVIRYLRRTKDVEHSRESAKWYYAQLVNNQRRSQWAWCLGVLMDELNPQEREFLQR